MRVMRLTLWLVLPLAAIVSWQARGHHAFSAEFDKDAPVTLEGEVTKVEWRKVEEGGYKALNRGFRLSAMEGGYKALNRGFRVLVRDSGCEALDRGLSMLVI